MPAIQEEEILARVADGSIVVITVDTSVFDRYGCKLHSAVLRALDQLRNLGVQFLLSEIIINEVKAHIAAEAGESQRALNKALKNQVERWNCKFDTGSIAEALWLAADPKAAASAQIEEYIKATGAVVLPASLPPELQSALLERYFESVPPFEHKKGKKHEFPDAFALLSLEAAIPPGKLALCVSKDSGWQTFADQSRALVCIPELEKALSFFNETGRTRAEQIVASLRAGTAPTLKERIEAAFGAYVEANNFVAHSWDTGFDYESEPMSSQLRSLYADSVSNPVVISSTNETVEFVISVEADIFYEASFHFFIRDSVDKDFVDVGSHLVSTQETSEFEVVITVERETSDDPEPTDIQIVTRFLEVNFGTIRPFDNDDPYYELER